MSYQTHQVPVAGGALTVGEWKTGDRPVLAIHGVSSTHMLWLWTVPHLTGYRVIAPDLRGRGASQGLPKNYGLAAHCADMLAVLDHFEIDRATVIGMSLGGFVATALAASHPDRIERVLLVDGGLPMANAAAMQAMSKEQIKSMLHDRFARLERPWPSLAAYRELFVTGTAPLLSLGDPVLDEYLRYDLVGAEPDLHVRLDATAVADDSADVFLGDGGERAATRLRAPTRMLYAEWSSGRDTKPAYSTESLRRWTGTIPGFHATLLPGTDHAATVMTASSGAAIASELGVLTRA